ncbi:MAG: type II toxin-antitoxin system ParD family antitoxin [Janthinobacterium lividum]
MPSRSALSVSLTPELTSYVAAQVASGRYRSASEVVRASLRLLLRNEPAPASAVSSAGPGRHRAGDSTGRDDGGKP